MKSGVEHEPALHYVIAWLVLVVLTGVSIGTAFLGLGMYAPVIEFGVFWLEIATAFIRGIILAVRLFANMLAGHTTLFVVLSFIYMVGLAVEQGLMSGYWYWPVTLGSVAGLPQRNTPFSTMSSIVWLPVDSARFACITPCIEASER